ncbi:heme/copper-type cytochrome/quinol oxidases, subunit 2 [Bacillus sp. OxB-1]|nr:heme/copper-type cytochrome/quinol oxidases, subunit 2 [Bacillus sp. OxB-1]
MKVALIVSTILVVIVLAIGLILTISVANSTDNNYSSGKSFSKLLWIYVLSIPFLVILTLIAIFIFI